MHDNQKYDYFLHNRRDVYFHTPTTRGHIAHENNKS